MCCDFLVDPNCTLTLQIQALIWLLHDGYIFESPNLISQANECFKVFEEFWSQQSMFKFFVLAHLVSIAQTPTFDAQVFAVSTSEISLEEFPEMLETLGVLLRIHPFVILIL
jgi:hypothetical protein